MNQRPDDGGMASDLSASLRIKTVTGQRPERFEECSHHYFSMFVELFMANANSGELPRRLKRFFLRIRRLSFRCGVQE